MTAEDGQAMTLVAVSSWEMRYACAYLHVMCVRVCVNCVLCRVCMYICAHTYVCVYVLHIFQMWSTIPCHTP